MKTEIWVERDCNNIQEKIEYLSFKISPGCIGG